MVNRVCYVVQARLIFSFKDLNTKKFSHTPKSHMSYGTGVKNSPQTEDNCAS